MGHGYWHPSRIAGSPLGRIATLSKRGINPLHDNVMDFAALVKGRFSETHGRLRAGIGWNGRHWGLA